MGVYGFLGVYGYLWVSMGLYRCLWVSMGVYGFLGIYDYCGMSFYRYYIQTFKILPIFSFKNSRRFENYEKRLKSHMCHKK